MEAPAILAERALYSRLRLDELRNRLNRQADVCAVENLAIFCAGSYARLEASEYSDIDLFFVYGPQAATAKRRTAEIRLFAAMINIAEQMDFPSFSNDSQYLTTMDCSHILEHLGSPRDDARNLFTLRMLMLLESRCIYGEETFQGVQREIIAAYYRDYPDHQASFEPWFLINDIARFWKTLLLNYEHKRNQPAEDEVQKNKQKVRNFKLKYSRMTICFATVAALAARGSALSIDQVLEIVQLTPQQRLADVADRMPGVRRQVSHVLNEYAWFIEQTGQTEEELRRGFEDKIQRIERFRRANAYGDAMFDLLVAIGEQANGHQANRLLRFLVI